MTDLGLLPSLPPSTREAYSNLRSIIDTDGALPAWLKRTYAAAVAAHKRLPELAAAEAKGAVAAGLTRENLGGAVAALVSVKGIGTGRAFTDAFVAAGLNPMPHQNESKRPPDIGAYLRAYFGDPLPPHLAALEQLDQRALAVYFLFRRGALDDNALAGKAAEILLCAVSVADYQGKDATVHARGARRAGATEAELIEGMLCAVPAAGLSAWARAGEAVLDSRDVVAAAPARP
jgi:alkylhydroperoxidase/carboxymuconolactone decarboxylase family protein YurZ